MRATKWIVVASVAVLFCSFAPQATAQSCQPGGVVICGGCTAYNLIVDSSFDQGCPNWYYWTGYSYRTYGTNSCGWTQYMARTNGPTSGVARISQDVTPLPMAQQGDIFSVSVSAADINNAVSYSNSLSIDIIDLNTGADTPVTTISGPVWCDTIQVSLGAHPEWFTNGSGHPLRVLFTANLVDSGAYITFTGVNFWQDYH